MTMEETGIPRLSQEEGTDLAQKIKNFGQQLSPTQRQYLGFALKNLANQERDVQGYDYYTFDYSIVSYDAYGNATWEDDYWYDWNTGQDVDFSGPALPDGTVYSPS